jgi:hypothetical protein
VDMNYISAKENTYWIFRAANLADQITAFRKYVLSNSSK